MKNYYFIGNGAYCYANSTSMLLANIGEEVPPALIEVLCGDSIGATLLKEKNLLYFDNPTLLPDLGITKALDILGFVYKTKVFKDPEDFPIEELKKDLKITPAILGPLDMGFLSYNPNHIHQKGADHFVLAYEIKDDILCLNDPEGFPHVFLPLRELKKAWMADKLTFPYNVGYYRYTFAPRRIEKPSSKEIYSRALNFFKTIYNDSETKVNRAKFGVGSEAIRDYLNYIKNNGLNEDERGHFTHFALPLGAKRASDYSRYFKQYNKKLSEIKYKQSQIFGVAQVYAANREWNFLAKALGDLSKIEEQFKTTLLGS